jgi:hypothetical protein
MIFSTIKYVLYHFPDDYADTIPFLLKEQKEKVKMNTHLEKEEK